MEQRSYVVDEANDGVRIDKYLALLMEECSRSYIQKIIGDQSVCVNGKAVKANFKIHTGDFPAVGVPESKITLSGCNPKTNLERFVPSF